MHNNHQKLVELLENSGPALHILLFRLTLREDVAEELMQELMINLSRSQKFEKVANPHFYAKKAAINLAFDWRRKQKRKSLPIEVLADTPGPADSPCADLIRREQLQELLDAVASLDKTARQVIAMRYVDQISYDEIARRLAMTPHHIRAICHRARGRLKKILGGSTLVTYEGGHNA